LENLATTYKNGVATTVQEIVVEEQNYVQIIRKINVVAQKTDGKLLETNLPRIYNLSGTTEVSDSSKQSASIPNDTYEELIYDFRTLENVTVGTGGFNKLIGDFPYHIAFGSDTYNSGDFITFKDDISSLPDKTFYLFMARILSDKNKKNEFINYVIKGDLVDWKNPVKLMNKFEKIVDDLGKTYEKEIKEEEKLFEKLKKETQFKKLTEGLDELMYPKGKARKFEYSTEPQPTDDDKKKLISDLYKTVNVDTNKSTFDGKIKFD
jgi:hypothetical protein